MTFNITGGTTQVDQLDPAGTTLLSRTKHYFYSLNSVGVRPFDYPTWDSGKEYQTEIIDTTNCTPATCATVLRRINLVWQPGCTVSPWSSSIPNNHRIGEVDTTLTDTGQVSKQVFGFDCYNNKTDVYTYDYGAVTPARHTHTDYVPGTAYTDRTGAHIRNLPSQVSLFDVNGVEQARTVFAYDNYVDDGSHNYAPLVDRPNISNFDPAFGTGYGTRGNPTSTTTYLLTAGLVTGSITSYMQFDIAGNLVKTIDGRGYATTLNFSDNFGAPNDAVESNGSPSNTAPPELGTASAYAFPFSVTNALGQKKYNKFDYYLGRGVTSKDINGIVSCVYFSDSLDRPTQIISAVNGGQDTKSQTTFVYEDANHSVTTKTDQTTYNDNLIKGQLLYDGLGRPSEKRLYEGTTNYMSVLTQYDSLGRAYKTSNPLRQGETAVWTTIGFDALDRVITVTTPDSATVSTYYSGNQVLVKDQAGKERMSQTNALGQLTDVWEITASDQWTVAVSFPGHSEVTYGYRSIYEIGRASCRERV